MFVHLPTLVAVINYLQLKVANLRSHLCWATCSIRMWSIPLVLTAYTTTSVQSLLLLWCYSHRSVKHSSWPRTSLESCNIIPALAWCVNSFTRLWCQGSKDRSWQMSPKNYVFRKEVNEQHLLHARAYHKLISHHWIERRTTNYIPPLSVWLMPFVSQSIINLLCCSHDWSVIKHRTMYCTVLHFCFL